MESLRRTKVSTFAIADGKTLDEISSLVSEGNIEKYIIPVERIFDGYRSLRTKPEFDKLIYNGNSLDEHTVDIEGATEGEHFRVYDSKDTFMGIFVYSKDEHRYKCEKMFLS